MGGVATVEIGRHGHFSAMPGVFEPPPPGAHMTGTWRKKRRVDEWEPMIGRDHYRARLFGAATRVIIKSHAASRPSRRVAWILSRNSVTISAGADFPLCNHDPG